MLKQYFYFAGLILVSFSISGCGGFHSISSDGDPGITVDVGNPNFVPDGGNGTFPTQDDGSKISIVKSEVSAKCLDDSSNLIVQNSCSGKLSQKYKITPTMAIGYYYIKNLNTGLCLDVGMQNSQLEEMTCNEAAKTQTFFFHTESTGVYSIMVQSSGYCLEVSGGSQANGAVINSAVCSNGTAQGFLTPDFVPPSDAKTVHAM